MNTCPPVHSHADHLACRYGGAYYHGMIRSLWMHQLAAWGLYPYFMTEGREQLARIAGAAGEDA